MSVVGLGHDCDDDVCDRGLQCYMVYNMDEWVCPVLPNSDEQTRQINAPRQNARG